MSQPSNSAFSVQISQPKEQKIFALFAVNSRFIPKLDHRIDPHLPEHLNYCDLHAEQAKVCVQKICRLAPFPVQYLPAKRTRSSGINDLAVYRSVYNSRNKRKIMPQNHLKAAPFGSPRDESGQNSALNPLPTAHCSLTTVQCSASCFCPASGGRSSRPCSRS